MRGIVSNIATVYQHYRNTSAILRRVLANPLTLDTSQEVIKDRLLRRKENFIDLLENAVFAFPASPYRVLLERANCSLEDIRSLIGNSTIERALTSLYKKGVYIDILEFKGKKDVVRGKDTYHFKEADFSNPLLTEGLSTKSGGTRSVGTPMVVPLEYIEQHNPYGVIGAHECGITENPVIIWLPILPAGEGLFFNLRFTAMGNPPVRWFSQVDERYIKPPFIDKLKTKSSIWMARFYGKNMPAPEFIDMRSTVSIAQWMSTNRGQAKGFSVVTYASSALRLILEAKKAGISLGETVFWLMGEPLTARVQTELEEFGCRAYSLYGCNELMIIGQGCARPHTPDDMHFCKDKLAAIQHTRPVDHSDHTVEAFLFTTLLKTSPKIFLNTETGDYGKLEQRSCGCGMEALGFTEHIHSVRSFEKLTAEGATFIGSDLIPLIQQTLPATFGGNANDYQFVEEADENGIPRLFMLISPDLGDIDEQRIKEVVFSALSSDEYDHSYSRSYWTQAGTLLIVRQHPVPTMRGKIMPLYIRRH